MHAGTLVISNAQASTVGNDSSGNLAGAIASLDAQDIWDTSQFAPLAGGVYITQLAFRMKPGTGSINATVTSASISLSTTTFTPATMSTTFATNRGADFTQVASLTGTLWSNPGCAGPSPCAFDIVYPFSTPFFYNPANGDLLIELQFTGYNGSGTGSLDVENYGLDPTKLVGEIAAVPAAPTTGNLHYSDSVTQLTFTAVPEPTSYLLALCGLGVLVVLQRLHSSTTRP